MDTLLLLNFLKSLINPASLSILRQCCSLDLPTRVPGEFWFCHTLTHTWSDVCLMYFFCILFTYFMGGGGESVQHKMHVEDRRQLNRYHSSPSNMWALGMQLRMSDLKACTFTQQAISLALVNAFTILAIQVSYGDTSLLLQFPFPQGFMVLNIFSHAYLPTMWLLCANNMPIVMELCTLLLSPDNVFSYLSRFQVLYCIWHANVFSLIFFFPLTSIF